MRSLDTRVGIDTVTVLFTFIGTVTGSSECALTVAGTFTVTGTSTQT